MLERCFCAGSQGCSFNITKSSASSVFWETARSLYLCSLPHCFRASFTLLQLYSHVALFTLFRILPLCFPQQYPVLSPFSFSWPVLFSVSGPPVLAPPLNPAAPLYIFFRLCFSSSVLRSSPARLGTVAGGGGRKAQLAALATCIIHVPCSRRGFSAGCLLGHTGLVNELCTGPDRSCTDGTAHFLISFVTFWEQRGEIVDQHSWGKWGVSLTKLWFSLSHTVFFTEKAGG